MFQFMRHATFENMIKLMELLNQQIPQMPEDANYEFQGGVHRVMTIYYRYRVNRSWTPEELDRIRPLLLPLADFLWIGLVHVPYYGAFENQPSIMSPERTQQRDCPITNCLKIRTIVKFLSDDLPELLGRELMNLYSDLSEIAVNPPFEDEQEKMEIRAFFVRFPDHVWWNIGRKPDEASVAELLVWLIERLGEDTVDQEVNAKKIGELYSFYQTYRSTNDWTVQEQAIILPHFQTLIAEMNDKFENTKNKIHYPGLIVTTILTIKSILQFICDDFREMRDIILPSELLKQVNKEIESWDGKPPFRSQNELLQTRQNFINQPTHYWWNIGHTIGTVDPHIPPPEPRLSGLTGATMAELLIEDMQKEKTSLDSVRSIYCNYRSRSRWTFDELDKLRPLMTSLAKEHLECSNFNKDRTIKQPCYVFNYLMDKTTTQWIYDDFPELAEILNQAPDVKHLNETIESWMFNPPKIEEAERDRIRTQALRFPAHTWWTIVSAGTDATNGKDVNMTDI